MKRTQIRWPVVIVAVVAVASCSIRSNRNGLYNNHSDPKAAIAAHQAAWRKQGLGDEISRIQMNALLRDHRGHCITEQNPWVRVRMDKPIEPRLVKNGTTIDCVIFVQDRLPFGIFNTHLWSSELLPVSNNRLRLIRTVHEKRGPDL